MAKVKCRSCGKMFSDVEVFCSKCGYPAESSAAPIRIGGRPAAGSAARRINRPADSLFDDEKAGQGRKTPGSGGRDGRNRGKGSSGRNRGNNSPAPSVVPSGAHRGRSPSVSRGKAGKTSSQREAESIFAADKKSTYSVSGLSGMLNGMMNRLKFSGLKSKNRLIIAVFILIIIIVIFNLAIGAIGMLVANVQDTVRHFTAEVGENIYNIESEWSFSEEEATLLSMNAFLLDFSDIVTERTETVSVMQDVQPEGGGFCRFLQKRP